MGGGDAEGTAGEFKFGCKRWKRKMRYSDERVLQDGLTLMSLRRYCG